MRAAPAVTSTDENNSRLAVIAASILKHNRDRLEHTRVWIVEACALFHTSCGDRSRCKSGVRKRSLSPRCKSARSGIMLAPYVLRSRKTLDRASSNAWTAPCMPRPRLLTHSSCTSHARTPFRLLYACRQPMGAWHRCNAFHWPDQATL
jgi:hypothetical protein